MSATIILIMTSSSTRNTEPRGGRVEVMMSVLAPSRILRFANIAHGRNANMATPSAYRYDAAICPPVCRLIDSCLNAKLVWGVPGREQGAGRYSFRALAHNCIKLFCRVFRQVREREQDGP